MSADLKLIEKLAAEACARIGEHAESVVVIVTAEGPTGEGGGRSTSIYKHGTGNWFAQIGSVKTWVQRQDDEESALTWNHFRPQQPPDDGESWKGA